MQSIWMQMTDKGAEFEQRDVPVPTPGPNQLLVRLHASSLNRGEFLRVRSTSAQPAPWKPAGGEGAGDVVSVGSDVRRFGKGDRVMGRCAGGFSEYALMEAIEAMPMPGEFSYEQAASIPLAFLVAFDMLVMQGRLQSGEWLLVNGVSSGVGVASLQLGKALGARVIGTSGSAEKLQRLQEIGLDVALHTRGADFAQAVKDATGDHGADLVVNTVGGTVFAEDIRAMAFEGRLGFVGYVDGSLKTEIDLELLHTKRLTLFGVSNKLRNKEQRATAIPRFMAEALPLFASGKIVPLIDRVVDLADVPEALKAMEAAEHVGKIVIRIP